MKITVSPKHGVNPSCSICFICAETKEVVLFGRLPKDAEAPRQVVLDYIPCKACLDRIGDNNLLLVEVIPSASGEREIAPGVVPSGHFWMAERPEDMEDKTTKIALVTEQHAREVLKLTKPN